MKHFELKQLENETQPERLERLYQCSDDVWVDEVSMGELAELAG